MGRAATDPSGSADPFAATVRGRFSASFDAQSIAGSCSRRVWHINHFNKARPSRRAFFSRRSFRWIGIFVAPMRPSRSGAFTHGPRRLRKLAGRLVSRRHLRPAKQSRDRRQRRNHAASRTRLRPGLSTATGYDSGILIRPCQGGATMWAGAITSRRCRCLTTFRRWPAGFGRSSRPMRKR